MWRFEKITVVIETSSERWAKAILAGPTPGTQQLAGILADTAMDNAVLTWPTEEKITLDLGELGADDFSAQFPVRLQQAWREFLQQNAVTSLPGDTQHQTALPSVTPEDVSQPPERLSFPGAVPAAGSEHTPLFQQACTCLRPSARHELLAQTQNSPALRRMWQQWLTATGYKIRPGARLTAVRLYAAALGYLLSQPAGVVWLGQQQPDPPRLSELAQALISGEVPLRQVARWFSSPALMEEKLPPAVTVWLLPIWRHPDVPARLAPALPPDAGRRMAIWSGLTSRRGDKPVVGESPHSWAASSSSCVTPPVKPLTGNPQVRPPEAIDHAGIALLWPLFPDLFDHLALTADGVFSSPQTRWQAVLALDWLACGELVQTEGLTLSRLLCGFSSRQDTDTMEALGQEQRDELDGWLGGIAARLPGWQNKGLTDVRQLWLQRSGFVVRSEPLTIAIAPRPWDILLDEWPWPLSVLSLPWLELPVILDWPRVSETG